MTLTNKRLSHQLDTISRIVQGWLDSQAVERTSEGLPIDDNTHLMRVPEWPSHGMLKAWVQALTEAAGELCQHLSTVGFENKERCLNCGATMVFGPDGLSTVEPNPGSRKTNLELADMLDRAAADYHDSDFWLIQVIREVSAELRRAVKPPAGCPSCKDWSAIGKAFCGDCGGQLPENRGTEPPVRRLCEYCIARLEIHMGADYIVHHETCNRPAWNRPAESK